MTKSLPPASYRAAARNLRRFADQLDARCKPTSPRELAALTSAVYRLSGFSRNLVARHRRRTGL